MTRSELKALVKECLLEILNDGLKSTQRVTEESKQSALKQRAAQQKQQQVSASIKEAIKRESKGDPIMEAIFADTAKTTLPKMMSDNPNTVTHVPHDAISEVVANHTPEQLFGEDATAKWAFLAFNNEKKI